MNQLVLFDCDGVLVDTEPLAYDVLVEALRAAGSDQAPALAEQCVGRSLADIRLWLAKQLPVTDSNRFWSQLALRTEEAIREGIKPNNCVSTTLEQIPYPTCVASSGTHQKIRLSLGCASLLSYFEGRIFSAEDVSRGKPAPDLFLYAARVMQVLPENCCVIEDSLPGLRAAEAAGMASIHFSPHQQSEHQHHVREFEDIPKLLEHVLDSLTH